MTPSANCYYLIRSSEGCRLDSYRDSGNVLTVGYGHTGADVKPHQRITMRQAEAFLAEDVGEAADAVCKYALPCSQGQFDAMVDFVFNFGEHRFAGSTLLRKHQVGNHTGAAREFAKWVYCNGKVLPGLVKRRAAEAHLYLSDKLPHAEGDE